MPSRRSRTVAVTCRTKYVRSDDQKYFLNVVRTIGGKTKGEGQLLSLSAIDYRSGEAVEYVCRDTLPATLTDGYNYFGIPLSPRCRVSASPLRYTKADGTLSDETYLVRTARGQHAKIQFTPPDAHGGTLTIRYKTQE